MFNRTALRGFALSTIAVAAVLASGCASIVHGGPRSVPVASNPPGASVSIYDRDGKMVSQNTTPFIATLPTKYRYFSGQTYKLVFEKAGYRKQEVELRSTMSGWYWGNIVFGGLIGMLIVDPNTGAMYNLAPNKVEQTLPAETAAVQGTDTLTVITTAQATPDQLAAMTLIKAAQ